MAPHRFSASALIHARPQDLYAIIADYHHGHLQIIPRPPFISLEVEQGGTGAGTVFRAQMRVLGQLQTFRGVVSEPEPGRVLAEVYDSGYVTTFAVEPRADGQHAYVTILTEIPGGNGIRGMLERWLAPRILRPVYVRELAQLAAVAGARAE